MYGNLIVEMAQVAEQEHMRDALMAQASAQARRARRRELRPGRIGRAWTAFWAPRDIVDVDARAEHMLHAELEAAQRDLEVRHPPHRLPFDVWCPRRGIVVG